MLLVTLLVMLSILAATRIGPRTKPAAAREDAQANDDRRTLENIEAGRTQHETRESDWDARSKGRSRWAAFLQSSARMRVATVLGPAPLSLLAHARAISTVPDLRRHGRPRASAPLPPRFITGFSLTADADERLLDLAAGDRQGLRGRLRARPRPSNLTTAIGDMELAFTDAAGRAPDVTELGAGNIGGMTLAPGVYKWGTGLLIPTDVTLTGSATDVWIFQIAQDLTVSSAAQRSSSTGGALPKNVFWQVAGLVDLGTTAHFEGVVLDARPRSRCDTGASINGRLLAQTSTDEKMAAVDAVLAEYLSYSPGCTYDNGWCNAPERAYADSGCGCRAAGGYGSLAGLVGAGGVAVLALARRARRKNRRALGGAVLAGAALVLAPSVARAQTPATEPTTKTSSTPSATTTTTTLPATTPGTPPTTATTVTTPATTTTTVTAPTQPDEHAPPPPRVVPVPEPGPRDAVGDRLGRVRRRFRLESPIPPWPARSACGCAPARAGRSAWTESGTHGSRSTAPRPAQAP